ncbi:MAG: hypothetical protein PUF51_06745, partial [Bifidobacteriaceae bacterium]|nr:hypothetical protein [Bifidobacteriaceae bacterium]
RHESLTNHASGAQNADLQLLRHVNLSLGAGRPATSDVFGIARGRGTLCTTRAAPHIPHHDTFTRGQIPRNARFSNPALWVVTTDDAVTLGQANDSYGIPRHQTSAGCNNVRMSKQPTRRTPLSQPLSGTPHSSQPTASCSAAHIATCRRPPRRERHRHLTHSRPDTA